MTVEDQIGRTREGERTAWSDSEIETAVTAADPTVLRGLLYYLTGDEEAAGINTQPPGANEVFGGYSVTDAEDVKRLRTKAAAFLRHYRDAGDAAIAPGAAGRTARSMTLAIGEEIPADEVEMWWEELGIDAWAHGLTWPEPPEAERLENFRVVVIGAGMGGLNAAVQLKHAGIPFTLVERSAGVGGTWFQNRYPGARVDTASRTYIHTIGIDFEWPGAYSAQADNVRYFNWIADRYGIRENIVFETEVVSLIWDEATATWEVTTRCGGKTEVVRANAVISSVGIFTTPNMPSFEGMDRFRGETCHSARWPEGLTTKDKRVAVIGTGCSGYQMVPEIARDARHLTLFQRTPQWTLPMKGYLSPFPPEISWLDRNFPMHKNFIRLRATWLQGPRTRARMMDIDPEWKDPLTLSAANRAFRDISVTFVRDKYRERPELAEKMVPSHPIMSARPVLVDSEYCVHDALLRDNVSLVTDAIEQVTETGIVTSDGTHHEVDLIVYATGFKVDDFLWPMEVRGRGGQSIEHLWEKDGARAFLGTMLPGFPNFFMIFGPNTTPQGGVSLANTEAIATRYILSCLAHLITEEKRSIEPTRAAYEGYNEELDEWEKRKIYSDKRANTYYQSSFGRSTVNCPIPGIRMWTLLRRPDFDELVVD